MAELDDDLSSRQAVQSEQLDHFKHLISQISSGQSSTVLSQFEAAWKGDPLESSVDWTSHRGPYGETVLHWIVIAKGTAPNRQQAIFDELLDEMIASNSDLIFETYKEEPYSGETLLHLAVAVENKALMEKIISKCGDLDTLHNLVNARATGSFFQKLAGCTVMANDLSNSSITAFDIAMLNTGDWDLCKDLMDVLLKSGAKPFCFTKDAATNGTVLHTLAAQCFTKDGKTKENLAAERIKALFGYLNRYFKTTPGSEHFLQTLDKHNFSPLQVAAWVGNEAYLSVALENIACPLWQWGHRCAVRLLLNEIDQPGIHGGATVYEILALQSHIKLLRLKIFAQITELKWRKFGKARFMEESLSFFILATSVTLTCMANDITSMKLVEKGIQGFGIMFAMIFSVIGAYQVHAAPKKSWLKQLPWLPDGSGTLCKLELPIVRNIVWASTAVPIMSANIMTGRYVPEMSAPIDACCGGFIFILWISTLKFLKFSDQAGLAITIIPKLLRKDLLPWLSIMGILYLATLSGLCVALKHTSHRMGSLSDAAHILGQGAFAPDVLLGHIRNAPFIVGVFVSIFTCIGVVALFNILIAMFTDTYEEAREIAFETLTHERALFLITAEQLRPAWLAKIQIGVPIKCSSKERDPLISDVEYSLTLEYDIGKEPWKAYHLSPEEP